MNIAQAVGKRIQELLFQNNLSIYKLAKLTNLNEQTITNLIKGKSKDVRLSTIYHICNAFDIDILEFFAPNYFRNSNIDI